MPAGKRLMIAGLIHDVYQAVARPSGPKSCAPPPTGRMLGLVLKASGSETELPRMASRYDGVSGRYFPKASFRRWKKMERSSPRTTSGQLRWNHVAQGGFGVEQHTHTRITERCSRACLPRPPPYEASSAWRAAASES